MIKKYENVLKVDVEKCELSEMNRELKRLASKKCRSDEKEKEFWKNVYEEVVRIKNKRFGGKVIKKCNYMGLSEDEIKGLSLEELKNGLNVVYSMRCYYKGNKKKSKEVEKMFELYKKSIKEVEEKRKFEELRKKFG